MPDPFQQYSNRDILELRPPRASLDPRRPYHLLVEPEHNSSGKIVDVATLFLTNRECPFRCLMCDLWKNTLEETVSPGDIPEQIRWGLEQLPPAPEIKLYNSGNFFDPKAIPPEDYPAIADLVSNFDNVIVENHPNLTNERCLKFRDLIEPASLEVALGLETCNPQVLASLNKQMTLNNFERATTFLYEKGIRTRAFLLLKPPYLNENEAVEWTMKSLSFAFDCGVSCCAVIPTRAGNGMMDQLQREGHFAPPRGDSLEYVLEEGLKMNQGRVFVDLWDVESFFPCDACRSARLERLNQMNLHQSPLDLLSCPECIS